MKRSYLIRVASIAFAAGMTQPVYAAGAAEDSGDAVDRSAIIVTGARMGEQPSAATTLPISIVDTPQSVTVIERDYLDDFGFDDINDVLRLVTGVNVERAESDRTYYNSRGFDIKSMRVDGLGLPNIWGVYAGQLDTAVFDRIEVVRGANGLLSGTGNPSGTVNFLRKRPTGERRLFGELSAGSWNRFRAEADVEVPLTSDGSWSARMVGAAPAPLPHRQALFAIQPVELLVVHHVPLAFEHDAHAPIAEPAALSGYLAHLIADLGMVWRTFSPDRLGVDANQHAGPAL
jgi:outer membrane receptor for ferric coprogen and ferric-rhodotorulic acid